MRRLFYFLSAFAISVASLTPLAAGGTDERWLTVYYVTNGAPTKVSLVPIRILVSPTLPQDKAIRAIFEMLKHPPSNQLRTMMPDKLSKHYFTWDKNTDRIAGHFMYTISEFNVWGMDTWNEIWARKAGWNNASLPW